MFERINALMENEQVQEVLIANEELITEAAAQADEFSKVIKGFVIEHPEEFLGENTEETYKNIRLFAEVATAQYMTEITTLYGLVMESNEQVKKSGIDDYL